MWQIDLVHSFQGFVAYSQAAGCRASSKKEAVMGLQLFLKEGQRRAGCTIFMLQRPGHHSFEEGTYPLPAHAHPRYSIKECPDNIL